MNSRPGAVRFYLNNTPFFQVTLVNSRRSDPYVNVGFPEVAIYAGGSRHTPTVHATHNLGNPAAGMRTLHIHFQSFQNKDTIS